MSHQPSPILNQYNEWTHCSVCNKKCWGNYEQINKFAKTDIINGKALSEVIDRQRNTSFLPDYRDNIEDSDALGLAVSHYFDYDPIRILEVAESALEDANFSRECQQVREMIAKLNKAYANV